MANFCFLIVAKFENDRVRTTVNATRLQIY